MIHPQDLQNPSAPAKGGLPARISALLIDDDRYDRLHIRRFSEKLGLPMDLQELPALEALPEAMDRNAFDLIMVDYSLPGGDGLVVLDMVEDHPANRNAARIMITGSNRTDVAVSAMKRGCADFLSKDALTPALFRETVLGALARTTAIRAEPDPALIQASVARALYDMLTEGVLQSALVDGLREAAETVGLEAALGRRGTIFSLISGLNGEDEFLFRQEDFET